MESTRGTCYEMKPSEVRCTRSGKVFGAMLINLSAMGSCWFFKAGRLLLSIYYVLGIMPGTLNILNVNLHSIIFMILF